MGNLVLDDESLFLARFSQSTVEGVQLVHQDQELVREIPLLGIQHRDAVFKTFFIRVAGEVPGFLRFDPDATDFSRVKLRGRLCREKEGDFKCMILRKLMDPQEVRMLRKDLEQRVFFTG